MPSPAQASVPAHARRSGQLREDEHGAGRPAAPGARADQGVPGLPLPRGALSRCHPAPEGPRGLRRRDRSPGSPRQGLPPKGQLHCGSGFARLPLWTHVGTEAGGRVCADTEEGEAPGSHRICLLHSRIRQGRARSSEGRGGARPESDLGRRPACYGRDHASCVRVDDQAAGRHPGLHGSHRAEAPQGGRSTEALPSLLPAAVRLMLGRPPWSSRQHHTWGRMCPIPTFA